MKKIIIIISILVVTLVIVGLYGTFAASSTASGSDNTYAITLTGSSSEVVVPAGSSKTIIYQITNTNKGKVQYGIVYSGENIFVRVWHNSQDSHTGIIDYGENKFIKLYIENTGTTESTVSIKTVLGYEHGGSLDSIVPSGYSLVSETYSPPVNLIEHITNLYVNGNPTLITQSKSDGTSDTYYYSYQDTEQTWGLMNDGLTIDTMQDETTTGFAKVITDTTALTSGTEGNIRYFGPSASVNNYIYFNCQTYPDTNCELWRIIGIVDGKVKIIRNESIGNLAWDQDKNQNSSLLTYSNNWETSSLQLFLNGLYYNREDKGKYTDYSGAYGTNITSLNLTTIGITEATRKTNIISGSTWYLGGYTSPKTLYPNDIYTYERTNTVGTTIRSGNPFTINANIGLMYASDYGYGTDLTKCSDNIYKYNSTTDSYACRTNNWLFNSAYELLITPHSYTSNGAWGVNMTGHVSYASNVYASGGVRPVLYLTPELVIELDGDGSSTDPYRIKVS